jgi:hypothetical protein
MVARCITGLSTASIDSPMFSIRIVVPNVKDEGEGKGKGKGKGEGDGEGKSKGEGRGRWRWRG